MSTTQERVAFIGVTGADARSFTRSAQLEARTLSPQAPQDQIKTAFLGFLVNKERLRNEPQELKQPYYCIVADDQNGLLTAAKDLLAQTGEANLVFKTNDVKDFFGLLSLVKLNSEAHSIRTDETTGIRVVHLLRGETAHPMHPAPNS